ncbi:hypothetical protein [Metabacillus fastidiosus]|uniref:hypothetical protein n=1 Tax=Metabacillus fastidiosus TaxID=1458 RepID=UPI002E1DBD12|nr:hypothetical protein [Metabacillus fastidiosus]
MTNKILIEGITKEEFLTEFTQCKKLYEQVIPQSLNSPLSSIKDDYLSFYFLVREINNLDRTEIFKKFNFSPEEDFFVTDVLKIAKENIHSSLYALLYNDISIPRKNLKFINIQ